MTNAISRDEKKRQVETVKAAKSNELFKRSDWHGHINYECNLCAYATLDALVMAGHLRTVHGIQTSNTATGARQAAQPREVAETTETEARQENTPAEPVILIQEGEVK